VCPFSVERVLKRGWLGPPPGCRAGDDEDVQLPSAFPCNGGVSVEGDQVSVYRGKPERLRDGCAGRGGSLGFGEGLWKDQDSKMVLIPLQEN
jgi:hypothetical protein